MSGYKLTIPESADGIVGSAYDIMNVNEEYQDEPYVGAFWYDPNNNELYGVKASPANDVAYYKSKQWGVNVRTGRALHKDIWNKEFRRKKDKRFSGNYTLKPRGRVFQFEDSGFVVFTGSWILEYPEAKEEIMIEFQLPEDCTEFRVDTHWDIGHGWSNEF